MLHPMSPSCKYEQFLHAHSNPHSQRLKKSHCHSDQKLDSWRRIQGPLHSRGGRCFLNQHRRGPQERAAPKVRTSNGCVAECLSDFENLPLDKRMTRDLRWLSFFGPPSTSCCSHTWACGSQRWLRSSMWLPVLTQVTVRFPGKRGGLHFVECEITRKTPECEGYLLVIKRHAQPQARGAKEFRKYNCIILHQANGLCLRTFSSGKESHFRQLELGFQKRVNGRTKKSWVK